MTAWQAAEAMRELEQIVNTYTWYQAYGNQTDAQPHAHYVTNPEIPQIWVANHVSQVRASASTDIEAVLHTMERAFAHCSHRMVIVDPFTPETFVARLALSDYHELTPTLQMVLEGPLSRGGSELQLREVHSEDDWRELYRLVRADHLEGKRTHHLELDESVTRDMVTGYRAKSAVQQFFLAQHEGVICGYGSAIVGPYGMGIIEDLFTAQAHRRRGIATALIAHGVSYARSRGMGPMLIGALVSEEAKALYAALGFSPRCLTRQYLFDPDVPSA